MERPKLRTGRSDEPVNLPGGVQKVTHDHVAIILDGERFFGLITRYDLLTFLRRSLP